MTLHFPDHPVKIAGKDYTLVGNFRTLANIEQALDDDIIRIQGRVLDMRTGEFTKLLSAALTLPQDEIGQSLLDGPGIAGREYALLKLTVMSWLRVALTDPESREKKALELGEMIARAASPGESTDASA